MRLRLVTAITTAMMTLAAPAAALAQAQGADNHDSSRVPVQLVVFGAAVLLVVVVGTGAYYARKKLGLDKPASPDEAASHH